MSETLRSTFHRVFRLENRRRAPRSGTLEHFPFTSAILGNTREVTVYLPVSYADRPETRYPVLYMQDGQNLFEAERAFIPGQHWRLREAADAALNERTAQSIIVVGVDNAGAARIDEYTPTRDESKGGGGRADDYGRMLLDELKPLIDAKYRTLPEQTAIGGSSLGGLVSAYLALQHPEAFKAAAVMSPSVWWDKRALLRYVESFDAPSRPRMWLDIGGREGSEALNDARALRDALQAKGWSDETLAYFEDRRADHSERAWAKRVRMVLEFLFPPTAS